MTETPCVFCQRAARRAIHRIAHAPRPGRHDAGPLGIARRLWQLWRCAPTRRRSVSTWPSRRSIYPRSPRAGPIDARRVRRPHDRKSGDPRSGPPGNLAAPLHRASAAEFRLFEPREDMVPEHGESGRWLPVPRHRLRTTIALSQHDRWKRRNAPSASLRTSSNRWPRARLYETEDLDGAEWWWSPMALPRAWRRRAIQFARPQGIRAGKFRLITAWPFPQEKLASGGRVKAFIVPESSGPDVMKWSAPPRPLWWFPFPTRAGACITPRLYSKPLWRAAR